VTHVTRPQIIDVDARAYVPLRRTCHMRHPGAQMHRLPRMLLVARCATGSAERRATKGGGSNA